MLKNVSDYREQQLKELKGFTDAVNREVADIVDTLGWTIESVTNVDKEHFTCPYDTSHRLTEGMLNDHLSSCQWKIEGYRKSDIPLSEPTLPADSPFCIKFDEQLQNQVLRKAKEQNPALKIGMGERLIPRTSDRLLANFTSDEKKALYDYAIANTIKPDIGQDIGDINNLKPQEKGNKELSFLELLLQERNLKRRRAKHRGVHTNKKSHTEILREVINQQMEVYEDYISGKNISEHVTDIQSTKSEDSSYEIMQNKTERSYKIFNTFSRNYDVPNSGERNNHRYSKNDNLNKERSEEKDYHLSKDQDRQEKYSDGTYKKHRHNEYKKSSHSKDRKSHKKDRHRSKDKHKDKHKDRHKKHKSQDCNKSSEGHYSRHSDHKRKEKVKEF